ncbi:MAG: 50S ribosomal protein L23 [Rickettsiales bacterium]|nr:50S ribosomal protein L23 [Rickettsiales bacterium]OUV82728.1 MAG: 50S ribosomal protein L23 [Rickettsiales bacterium TMED131]
MEMNSLYKIILSPVITEKATKISEKNQYVFKVRIDSNKKEIKEAIEKLFKVKVKSVNTTKIKGKIKIFKGTKGKRSDYKKAIISLNEGENLDYSGGVN